MGNFICLGEFYIEYWKRKENLVSNRYFDLGFVRYGCFDGLV